MTGQHAFCVVSVALLLASSACSKQQIAAEESPKATAAAEKNSSRAACALVTAAEMSAIVGTAVVAEGDGGGGSTTCRYKPADRSMPYVELTIDWGSGRVAMASFGTLMRLEPGIANRFEGLGDQATAIGPALMIRTGDDLVNLTLMGVDDDVASAKRIVSLMRPRMGPSAQPKSSSAGETSSGANGHADPPPDETSSPRLPDRRSAFRSLLA